MYVPEINLIKDTLDSLKAEGIITTWELPYESLLTRRSAAIFFIAPSSATDAMPSIETALSQFEHFSVRENREQKLSKLPLRVTFNEEEVIKNRELLQAK